MWESWGEKIKKKERERAGYDGKEKERREAPAFSLFPSSSARFLFFFSIIAIFIGIPSGGLCGEEIDNEIIEKHGGGRDLKRG